MRESHRRPEDHDDGLVLVTLRPCRSSGLVVGAPHERRQLLNGHIARAVIVDRVEQRPQLALRDHLRRQLAALPDRGRKLFEVQLPAVVLVER